MTTPEQPQPTESVWAPGVYNNFLREITRAPDQVAGGIFVGSQFDGLRIEGVIATTAGGRLSAPILDDAAWSKAQGIWSEFYKNQRLVGWYASRPGQGAIPTEADVAAHRTYFQGSQALLVCVDPVERALVGYMISEAGAPVEVVRGRIEESVMPVAPEAPAAETYGVDLVPWAVGGGAFAGAVLYLATLASGNGGWPFI